jgi:transcriptional regulator with XRE-family HTH domain
LTGRELKQIRLRLGLTQEQMARMLAVKDGNTISRYEIGRRGINPSLALLIRHLAAGCRLKFSARH